MNANFARSLASVLRHEGGYSNHPKDKGGPTNKGITLAAFQANVKPGGTVEDLKRITDAQVATVYREAYWNLVGGDDMPGGVDYALFDFGVNSGPSRAVKFLQRLVNVDDDGYVGALTLGAVRAADPIPLIKALCDARLDWLQTLDTWDTFGKGWGNRVNDVRDDAVQLASAPVILPTTPNPPPPDIPLPDPRQPEKAAGSWKWWIIAGIAIAAATIALFFIPI